MPTEVRIPAAHRSPAEADPDEIVAAFAPLTGDARLALATKGRAAEIALVEALELDGPPTVLAHPLFSTTGAALARRGARVEELRLARPEASAEVDLDHLDARLAAGGVRLVYLELACNALFGWPLAEAHVAAVRAACDRHGALLLLDAARPLTNSAGLGAPDLVGTARRILALAHAFTISCAKELLVPGGSVIGSPDAALIARACQRLFASGTSLTAIDPRQPRAELRDGARYALAHPAAITDRLALARDLAAALQARGVAVVQPVTAHAVYVPVERALLPAGDLPAMHALLGHLYVHAGVRAQLASTVRGPAIRLALPLGTALDPAQLGELATGIAGSLARLDERLALRVLDGQVDIPFFRRLAPTSSPPGG